MTHITTLASAGTNYTPIGVLLAIIVPICAAVAVIVWDYYRLQRHRADAVAMASYRKLPRHARLAAGARRRGRGLLGPAQDPLRQAKDALGRPGPLSSNPRA